jgi:lactoylglutathione lyase
MEDLLSARLGGPALISAFDAIMDGLDAILTAEGFSVPEAHDCSSLPMNSSAVAVSHVALWTSDLERSRAFYERYFGARAGASYFLQFPSGCRVELMQAPEEPVRGWAHLALSLGSRQQVDDLTERLAADGVPVRSGPRQTGDGYYESVVEDPDGNELEVTA